jgi:hypothetical protein
MKKSNLLILGLIALMLAGGLVLASCGGVGCEGAGNCTWNPKTEKGQFCSTSRCIVPMAKVYEEQGSCDCSQL